MNELYFSFFLMICLLFIFLFVVLLPILSILHIIQTSIESRKFPDEEEYYLSHKKMSKDELYTFINLIFPIKGKLEQYSYDIIREDNVITIENRDKYSRDENYKIIFHDNNNLLLICYFNVSGVKYTSYKVTYFSYPSELLAKYTFRSYTYHKMKIIQELGYNYEDVKKNYINRYSNYNSIYYRSPFYKIQSLVSESWIEL